ncbi:NRPS-like enzyme [Penicillium frequentans]|uniref:NRPS-like enzyme n=1 Tax=Penicillium frequentans TaxID=3151616 RepID=A0AAD6CLC3_9EURO|nr:NRPS-like enzyme [Penicillium glabrum]
MAGQSGERLWPTIVDHRARSAPSELVGLIPKSSDVADGYQELTSDGLARAVDACAHWIEKHVGCAKRPETIAYMGSNDVRYLILILACHKTGYEPLLVSTRLSDEGYKHILTATHCQKFIYTPDKQRRVSEIQAAHASTEVFEIPSLKELLESNASPYPFEKSFRMAENEVAIIIHSSGTTGMPKPAPLTHGFLATIDNGAYLSRPQGRRASVFFDLEPGQSVLSTTPLFHLMGLMAFTESIFHGIAFVMCPDKPMSTNLIVDVIQATHPTAALLAPSLLVDMVDSSTARAALRTLDAVYFGGAPLSPEVGDALEADTKVITLFGSSEMGLLSSFVPQGEKVWGYFEWNPAYGVKMEPQGDGLYELIVPRCPDSRRIHGIFHTFPHLNEYHTNDLFVQHSERPELWRYHGRKDDLLVLCNGEKLNPVSLEEMVESHPSVKHAIVLGQSRFQTSLLIEPITAVEDEHAFVETIWPKVERANETVPKYGRISKNKIELASPGKPFKMTPKGTKQRRTIASDYQNEIEAIYEAAETNEAAGVPPLPKSLELEYLREYVRNLLEELLSRSDIKDEEDLYEAGLDSLQTIQLAQTLNTAVAARMQKKSTFTIKQQHIYAHSTTVQLAQFLADVVEGRSQTSTVPRAERLAHQKIVILTGSTGSLGGYLLHQFLKDPKVAKVYCFNRSDNAQSRQRAGFISKGLDPSLLDDPARVEFLTVSFAATQFGLPGATYNKLLGSVNLVVHNAWKVNFNHPLESFEDPHLRGVLEFLWFSHRSAARAHFTFISSVSTIGGWDSATMGSTVPEAPIESNAVMEQGYGESKYVGEQLCLAAARDAGIPTTVLRVGQIGGPTTQQGLWNVDEWLPSLVKTSVAMGVAPADLGAYRVDWVPVDVLAQIAIDLTSTRLEEQERHSHGVYHLVNPNQVKWDSLVPAIHKKYPGVKILAFKDWLRNLEAVRSPSEDEVRTKPALKLLDFYRALTRSVLSAEVSVKQARKGSATMAGLGPVTPELLENWLEQWQF